ncbi:MipA/OmpV family protein [Azospirillum halopraeferens]|uniref:MipA/OmpV family protein n=1 Tax=Azospirillum halopraeferens TaxID=34010 RepID=UPI00040ABC2A|nr:MipA/OmpV family protein [Azospirillum halopraeferens]
MRRASIGRGMALATAFCVTAVIHTTAANAAAQDGAPGDWSFTVGAGALYIPDYEGSDEFEVLPLPIVEVSWRDRVRLTTIGGPGLYATPFVTDGLRFDLGVRYEFGRKEDDNDALKGLGDLDVGAVGVVRLGYAVGPVDLGLVVARDITGDRKGLTATLEAEYAIDLFGGRGRLGVTSYVTWADDEYMGNTFGVTAAQAARSARRYTRYDAAAGVKDAGVAVALAYKLTDSIQAIGGVGYGRLLGDAADSPLVDREGSADQFMAQVGVSYRW